MVLLPVQSQILPHFTLLACKKECCTSSEGDFERGEGDICSTRVFPAVKDKIVHYSRAREKRNKNGFKVTFVPSSF